jgi:hypothetical protein
LGERGPLAFETFDLDPLAPLLVRVLPLYVRSDVGTRRALPSAAAFGSLLLLRRHGVGG